MCKQLVCLHEQTAYLVTSRPLTSSSIVSLLPFGRHSTKHLTEKHNFLVVHVQLIRVLMVLIYTNNLATHIIKLIQEENSLLSIPGHLSNLRFTNILSILFLSMVLEESKLTENGKVITSGPTKAKHGQQCKAS